MKTITHVDQKSVIARPPASSIGSFASASNSRLWCGSQAHTQMPMNTSITTTVTMPASCPQSGSFRGSLGGTLRRRAPAGRRPARRARSCRRPPSAAASMSASVYGSPSVRSVRIRAAMSLPSSLRRRQPRVRRHVRLGDERARIDAGAGVATRRNTCRRRARDRVRSAWSPTGTGGRRPIRRRPREAP